MLVMTLIVRPAAGLEAGLLHEVEHVVAVHVRIILPDWEMCVKPAGSSFLPLGAEVSLIFHSPRF